MENAVRLATALQAYKQKEKSGLSDVNTLLTMTKLREGSFDTSFPTMFSLHGLDIRQALEEEYQAGKITENAKNYAILGINNAMDELATRDYPILTDEIFHRVEGLLQNFVDIFYEDEGILLGEKKKELMDKPFRELKALFKTPYIVVYNRESSDTVSSIKLLHNSFANLRSIVNKKIHKNVVETLRKNKVTNSALLEGNYLTSKIINWGHTAYGEKIISGKLIASLISLKGIKISNSEMNIIAKDFLKETGQEKEVIKIKSGNYTSGSADVLRMVLESERVQKVKVQGVTKNQIELGQQERAWNLLKTLANVKSAFNNKQAIAAIVAERLLRVRSSPAPIEKIEILLTEAIKSRKRIKFPQKDTILLDSKKPIKIPAKKIVVSRSGRSNLRKDTIKSKVLVMKGEINLEKLISLINYKLHEQIRKNMGIGSRTDILNYRSGRFAKSAKLEKATESREGMITAFYSYMKNPYATFSTGGKQEFPRSRDPKLLISKSIREIAADYVQNKLRAVAL